MIDVVGVKFRDIGKVYYFKSNNKNYDIGDMVIVETVKGIECGTIVRENKTIDETQTTRQLKEIVRLASKADIKKLEDNKKKEKEAYNVFLKKLKKHKLDMKLIDVEYTFDNSKILFYFTADGRVDFRDLVKDLASVFRTRIELRQIGIRDESRIIGGLGICGRPLCCNTFLGDIQPVSIKMAKEQGMSLNPSKISGTCSRLMCCLKYEQEAYTELLKDTPNIGAVVDTPEGRGVIVEHNLLTKKLIVRMDRDPEAAPLKFGVGDITVIKDTKIKVKKEELDKLKELE